MSPPFDQQVPVSTPVSSAAAVRSDVVSGARKLGRDLEVLVALCERVLHDGPIEVRSPEMVIGRAGTTREIDVSLRGSLAGEPVFVMIECRDRKSTQGIGWIDSVIGKAGDVGATKVVVVSSSPFTADAIARAGVDDVELRQLDGLSSADVFQWVASGLDSLTVVRRVYAVTNLVVEFPGWEAFKGRVPLDRARRTADGSPLTLEGVWSAVPSDEIYVGLAPGERRTKRVQVSYTNPDDRFEIEAGGSWHHVRSILITAEVWIEEHDVPVTAFRYTGDGDSLVEGVRFEVDAPGGPLSVLLSVREQPDGSNMLTLAARPYTQAPPTHLR